MTHSATPAPVPSTTVTAWKIELKVIVSTAVAFVMSLLVALLNAIQAHHELLGSTPGSLQFVILAVIPTAVTFLGGYLAKHTPRTITQV